MCRSSCERIVAVMTTHAPRDIFGLDHHPHTHNHPHSRKKVRNLGLAAVALASIGVTAVAIGADDTQTAAVPSAPVVEDCDSLWARVRALGLPETASESAAATLGLTVQGPWISSDGLTWEHLDGRTMVVATPLVENPTATTDCAADAATDEGGRS